MAPEMVTNRPYDHNLDIWCLGILLFEMLHGYAPYKGKSDKEKCENINHLITHKKDQLKLLNQYKQSIIYEYVTGKKQVPTEEGAKE